MELFEALLRQYEIGALLAKHTPQGMEVSFDVAWLPDNALAASFPRTNTARPHFITLSPLLLKCDFTDRIAFSTIILHELGHVIDRVQNWTKYVSIDPADHEMLEYKADDFVIACGRMGDLIETLRRSIVLGPKLGMGDGMASKRLSRIVNLA